MRIIHLVFTGYVMLGVCIIGLAGKRVADEIAAAGPGQAFLSLFLMVVLGAVFVVACAGFLRYTHQMTETKKTK